MDEALYAAELRRCFQPLADAFEQQAARLDALESRHDSLAISTAGLGDNLNTLATTVFALKAIVLGDPDLDRQFQTIQNTLLSEMDQASARAADG